MQKWFPRFSCKLTLISALGYYDKEGYGRDGHPARTPSLAEDEEKTMANTLGDEVGIK